MKRLSRYKNYVTASKKQVFLSVFADYLLTFILTFLLYAVVASPTIAVLPSTTESFSVAQHHAANLLSIIDTTRLQSLNGQSGLNDIEVDAKEYALTLAKTSYYLSGDPFPRAKEDGSYEDLPVTMEETFLNVQEGKYPNDRLSYYFITFKETDPSIASYVYEGKDYRATKNEFLFKKAFGYTEDWFVLRSDALPLEQQLSKDNAVLMASYLVYKDSKTAPKDLFNAFLNHYQAAVNLFVREVETKYGPYLSENQAFTEAMLTLDLSVLLGFSLAFLAAFLILELLPPLISKQGKTIGNLALKIAPATSEEEEPRWWNYALKSLVRMIIHYSGIFFCLLVMGSISIAFYSFGWFTFAMAYLFGGILGIASIITMLVRKDNRGLPELASGLVYKDTTQMERGTALEEEFHAGELKP